MTYEQFEVKFQDSLVYFNISIGFTFSIQTFMFGQE